MLSVDHPSSISAMGALQYGLQPFRDISTGRFLLAIKVTKEAILTARLNGGFRVYVARAGQRTSVGLITAFFDDEDEPITIRTPLGDGDPLTADLLSLLAQESFEVYFFDELDRELLGYLSRVEDLDRFRAVAESLCFPRLALESASDTHAAMVRWFGLRTPADDAESFQVTFRDRLYADDLLLIEAHQPDIRGRSTPAFASLEREEPGEFQEQDIARLLWRVFPGDCVIVNPIRTDTGRELCDVLVTLADSTLLIQAKDSPNTAAALRRPIARKIAASISHLEKATSQMRGALRYVRSSDELALNLPDEPLSVPSKGKAIRGLIVLNEMFDHNFRDYSLPVLELARETRIPIVVLDYATLHGLALRKNAPERFYRVLDDIFAFAVENGEFPRPRFLGRPD